MRVQSVSLMVFVSKKKNQIDRLIYILRDSLLVHYTNKKKLFIFSVRTKPASDFRFRISTDISVRLCVCVCIHLFQSINDKSEPLLLWAKE